MSDPTLLVTEIEQDLPVVLNSDYRFNNNDRRKIDNQILGLQQMAKASILDGTISSWYKIDPSPSGVDLVAGQCVCQIPSADGTIVVTPATAVALAAAGAVLGIAMAAGAKGEKVRVATGGIVAATVTGFGPGSAQPVRVGVDTFPERVVALGADDFPLGIADTAGNIALIRGGVSGSGGTIVHGASKQIFFTDITGATTQWLTAAQDLTVSISGSNANFGVVGLTGNAGSLALFGVSNLSWSTGTSAPSASVVDGSLYTRTGGSNGDLYLRRGGAWVDIGAAAVGQFGTTNLVTTGTANFGSTTVSGLTLGSLTGILVASAGTVSSVTGANARIPFWSSNTLSTDAGLTFGSSTLSATNVTVATNLTLTALAGTDGPLQVVGGVVGVGPGGSSTGTFLNVPDVTTAEAKPVTSLTDGTLMLVRSLHGLFELVTASRTADHSSILSTPTVGRFWVEF